MGWNSRDGAWFCIYCKDSVGFAIELDVGYERKEGSRMTGFYPQQLEGRKNTGVADRPSHVAGDEVCKETGTFLMLF